MKNHIFLYLKGVCMGAADIVPGVSGGTIAFITGIYETLISALKSINGKSIMMLLKGDLKGFWTTINGKFLIILFLGIGTSIVSLAKLISFLLEEYPIMLWAFFFGLIVASAWLIGKKIKQWKLSYAVVLILGAASAFLITELAPTQTPNGPVYIFGSGLIAICAMILPGISGSFLLLIMGKYSTIINAIKEVDLLTIAYFGAGAAIGLVAFSNVLSWMFKKYHDMTVALLCGFMIGSLNKVWPWKEILQTEIDRHGKIVVLQTKNIMPFDMNDGSFLWQSICLAVLGFLLIWVLESRTSVKS